MAKWGWLLSSAPSNCREKQLAHHFYFCAYHTLIRCSYSLPMTCNSSLIVARNMPFILKACSPVDSCLEVPIRSAYGPDLVILNGFPILPTN